MDILTVLIIALGLAMDAFALSISSGLAIKKIRIGHAFRIALFFGSFQAIMPVVGWLAGLGLKGFISAIDHWIAFALLSFVGGKMIYESTFLDEEKEEKDTLNIYILLILSIATSIDALAVGFTLSFLDVDIASPAIIIGMVTFLLSFSGVYMGGKFGHFFESKIEIAGGLILIGIGIKILVQHLGA
ncbi:MAG: manganese efflux pump MntP family protein [Deltaproteobacteria bacterium]|nr:manganese efflux pump MntP family protein [Deltaproteobacteria bacterium]